MSDSPPAHVLCAFCSCICFLLCSCQVHSCGVNSSRPDHNHVAGRRVKSWVAFGQLGESLVGFSQVDEGAKVWCAAWDTDPSLVSAGQDWVGNPVFQGFQMLSRASALLVVGNSSAAQFNIRQLLFCVCAVVGFARTTKRRSSPRHLIAAWLIGARKMPVLTRPSQAPAKVLTALVTSVGRSGSTTWMPCLHLKSVSVLLRK